MFARKWFFSRAKKYTDTHTLPFPPFVFPEKRRKKRFKKLLGHRNRQTLWIIFLLFLLFGARMWIASLAPNLFPSNKKRKIASSVPLKKIITMKIGENLWFIFGLFPPPFGGPWIGAQKSKPCPKGKKGLTSKSSAVVFLGFSKDWVKKWAVKNYAWSWKIFLGARQKKNQKFLFCVTDPEITIF